LFSHQLTSLILNEGKKIILRENQINTQKVFISSINELLAFAFL